MIDEELKGLKLIHLFSDDKFVDVAIKLFEDVCPNQSDYWIITKENKTFKYVTSIIAKPLFLNATEEKQNFLNYIISTENSVVFFHALDDSKQTIVNQLPKYISKIWFLWGFDFYGSWPLIKKNNYEEFTNKKFGNNKTLKDFFVFNEFAFNLFKNKSTYKYILPKTITTILENNYNTEYYKAVNKIDIVVPVIPDEFFLVKKINPNIKYAPFTYGSIEDLLGTSINKNVLKASNILVGNSADPSNNHLDVFHKLSKYNLGDRKVIVPLSYSGNSNYRDQIIFEGNRLLKHNFYPITEFMSLKEYTELLLTCGTLIFNHVRQQGVGNIISMGYMGANLYLNEKSPVYSYYKNEGIFLYNTNELSEKKLNSNLTLDKYKQNQTGFYRLYSMEKSIQKVKDLLAVVKKNHKSKK